MKLGASERWLRRFGNGGRQRLPLTPGRPMYQTFERAPLLTTTTTKTAKHKATDLFMFCRSSTWSKDVGAFLKKVGSSFHTAV
jgi:hypothetical protein